MVGIPERPANPSSADLLQLVDHAEHLSDLWHNGQVPDIHDFIAGIGRLSAEELSDVLCTDQRHRWLQGKRPAAEDYLQLHSSYHPNTDPAIELVLEEFLVRREVGDSPTIEEYDRRFPQYSRQLRRDLSMYDLLTAEPSVQNEDLPASTAHAMDTDFVRAQQSGLGRSDEGALLNFESDYESFKVLLRDISREQSVQELFSTIVRRLAERPNVALARIWVVRPGDLCASCPALPECADQSACLHLMASSGRSLDEMEDWARLNGRNQRVPFGVRKVGLIAARGEAMEVLNLTPDAPWLASPEWAKRENIRAFSGQPLIHNGQTVGVLAVFFRTPLVGSVLMWLHLIAARAAAAIVAEEGSHGCDRHKVNIAGHPSKFQFPSAVYPELPGYEILSEVGRGGMGIVYKARQASLRRVVAIKVVPVGGLGEGQVVARFKQERLFAAQVAHPNLVAAYDAGAIAGLPYFIMEYVDGAGVDRLLRQQKQFSVPDACEIVRQVAVALQHLHERNLVHRDIKPSNLMITASGQVKVLDLGLARLISESNCEDQLTAHGQLIGTIDYMAPEQCDNCHNVDIRADIYALGCTLYHLLVGGPPFGKPSYVSVYQKIKAHSEVTVPSIRARRPDVPESVDAILSKMLAKNRAERFATPIDLASALQPFSIGAKLSKLLEGGSRAGTN
jgi:hypothetical protein